MDNINQAERKKEMHKHLLFIVSYNEAIIRASVLLIFGRPGSFKPGLHPPQKFRIYFRTLLFSIIFIFFCIK